MWKRGRIGYLTLLAWVSACGTGLPAPTAPLVIPVAAPPTIASERVVAAFVAEGITVTSATNAIVIGNLAENGIDVRYVANLVTSDSGAAVSVKPFAHSRIIGGNAMAPEWLEFGRGERHKVARAAWARIDRIASRLAPHAESDANP